MKILFSVIAIIIYGIYAFFRLRKELHNMQLNSYRNERYLRWWKKNLKNRFYKTPALGTLGALPLLGGWTVLGGLLFSLFYGIGSYRIFSQKEKKPLVFTKRATRLFGVTVILFVIDIILTLFFFKVSFITALILGILAYLIPVFYMIANILLIPVEKSINQSFVNDAARILKSLPNLKIVGITGSYGKTSTKHFLEKILAQKYNVLITPGSYNTLMGVVITVRNWLKPIHQVFIVEMGARQEGDIKEICDLAHPEIGIITAVAEQHLETFGSIENVQKTKMELLEALPSSGKAILNADYDTITSYQPKNAVGRMYYGLKENSVHSPELMAKNVRYTPKGMQFEVWRKGQKLMDLETKLLGEHNISNILASCCVALELEVPVESVKYAVKRLAPVQHRLEVKRRPNGITIIDDAFNSNPHGSKMALEVLGKIEGNRKIIITPGMVELGQKEYDYNKAFGEYMADVCDYVILVGKQQTQPIQDGLKARQYNEKQLFVADSLTEANAHLRQFIKSGDVVLYENDLPDTY